MTLSEVSPTAMGEASDADLIAASGRQPERFGLLFDRHVDRIHAYIARRVGPSLVEELTAETFSRAFERRDRFVALRDDALPWLYGIATNVVRNASRAERRQIAAYARSASLMPPASDESDDADERLDVVRASERLSAAVVGLAPGERDALLLFAWQELTYEEISVALGVPIGTVASRISRARSRLRAALGTTHDEVIGGMS